MGRRQFDALTVAAALSAAVLWMLAAFFLLRSHQERALGSGILLVVAAAVVTGLTVIRNWTLRVGRAFTHGYHAGYHDAMETECAYPQPCDVLELAESQKDY